MNKLRVFEAFAGYGSQSIALRNLGIPHEVVAISEIDKYAIKAYNALHGSTLNLGDISKIKVEDIPQHDLFTYSFPCQDLSVAGKQAGLGKGTRSGLLYECEKIIEHCRPKYLLLENVKNLVGKKFKPEFDKWLEYLEGLGYTNYWKVLNAKDYGVPQNRERVFVVSILGNHKPYEFAGKIPLDKCIADILEDEVDEKYYISNDRAQKMLLTYRSDYKNKRSDEIQQVTYPKFSQQRIYSCNGISPTLSAGNNGGGKEPCKLLLDDDRVRKSTSKQIAEINQLGMLDIKGNEQIRRVYGVDGISPTLNTMQGGNRQPKILIPQATKKGYIEMDLPGVCDLSYPNSKHCKCESGWQDNQVGIEYTPTLRAGNSSTFVYHDYRIRKLTPRECFRLMGMRDDDIDKIQQAGISNTQQYKMAGNSIVIDVLEAIFRNLFLD